MVAGKRKGYRGRWGYSKNKLSISISGTLPLVSPVTSIQGQSRTLAAPAYPTSQALCRFLVLWPRDCRDQVTQLPGCCWGGRGRSELGSLGSWKGMSGANQLHGRLSPHATFTLPEDGKRHFLLGEIREDASMTPR